jgi:hypothetical protein
MVIVRGRLVPYAQTIEMRSSERTKPKEQQWFARTPSCVLGLHKDGWFKEPELKKMTQEETDKWGMGYQDGLRKLAWLLEELRTVVKEQMSEVDGQRETINYIYETKKKIDPLPKEIVARFWSS